MAVDSGLRWTKLGLSSSPLPAGKPSSARSGSGGESTRRCNQLVVLADVIEDGGYLEATIDHAADTTMGLRLDLRRIPLPIGHQSPSSSRANFPFAFSVPGRYRVRAGRGLPRGANVHEAHVGHDLGSIRLFLATHVHRDYYTQAVVLRRLFGSQGEFGTDERGTLEHAEWAHETLSSSRRIG